MTRVALRLVQALVLPALLLLASATPADACMECYVCCDGRECFICCFIGGAVPFTAVIPEGAVAAPMAVLTPLGDDRVELKVGGFITEAMPSTMTSQGPTAACSVALPIPPSMARPTRGSMFYEKGGRLASYDFRPDPESGASIAQMLEQVELPEGFPRPRVWQGLSSGAAQDVPASLLTEFRIVLKLQPGTTLEGLAGYLAANGLLASGSTDSSGRFNGDHYAFRRLGDVVIHLPAREPLREGPHLEN